MDNKHANRFLVKKTEIPFCKYVDDNNPHQSDTSEECCIEGCAIEEIGENTSSGGCLIRINIHIYSF